jgi:hypothetical protein
MDPDVIHDPVFQQLLLKYELESRKLRDAVIAMRSFYLTHHKSPQNETAAERWKGSILSEDTCQRHLSAESAAADLLRYAFEIAPHSDNALHLEELFKLKMAHRERLERRTGWGKTEPHPRGIEEKVLIDGGPPITWVINPKNYEFTEQARRRREQAEAAIPSEKSSDSPDA